MSGEKRYFNRDLSWLEFNRRVLYQATDKRHPLLERLRFLSIFSSNLDEFFMKRVGYLKRVVRSGLQQMGHEQSAPREILTEVRRQVSELLVERERCFADLLASEVRQNGVAFIDWAELSAEEQEAAKTYFHKKVFPVLTPLAFDPTHPFPFLSNLSLSVGVRLRHPKTGEDLFARIKIPNMLPQWVHIESATEKGVYRLLSLTDLVRHNLEELFPEMIIENVMPFRVTRSADIEMVSDDAEDLMDVVEEELRLRRVAEVVRLECGTSADANILRLLSDQLELSEDDIYRYPLFMNYSALTEVVSLDLPALKYEPHRPVVPVAFADEKLDIFRLIREEDRLIHLPYESFAGTVQRFIEDAVEDENVLAIKMTLYRAGDHSPLIPLLIRAAEKGKQVVVVVELKARFDEARNIYWGEMLEKAGVHVVYGVVGKKVHAKLSLVIRREEGDYRLYGHVGSGNYNVNTAKLYTDVGLMTADAAITQEMVDIFNYLTGLSRKRKYQKFLVAPLNMKKRFSDMIHREVSHIKKGMPAGIIAKMNSLEDQAICDALYEASQAGVPIELIVRGFCTLRPGVPGLSENIRIVSTVGRFLEHSRIFYFRAGAEDPVGGDFFLGSADWMYRNLNNRIEAIVPIEATPLKQEAWKILQAMLMDRVDTWDLTENGQYVKRPSDGSQGVQALFVERYKKEMAKQKKKRARP